MELVQLVWSLTGVAGGRHRLGDRSPEGPLGVVGTVVTAPIRETVMFFSAKMNLITTQAKRNLSSRSGIGGVRSAT